MIFKNRRGAGRKLAEKLKAIPFRGPIVIALPRGGVPVGFEIAQALQAEFDILVVRKIGAPAHPEYGIGAMTEDGTYWIDKKAARGLGATETEINETIEKEALELKRRVRLYRAGKPLASVLGKTVIVVDDGLATGATARVACQFLKEMGASRVVLVVPVCSPRTAIFLRSEIDEVICLLEPESFRAVGQFYEDFSQTSDEEVMELLRIIHGDHSNLQA